jgi:CheY-like chemotaxis protein
MSTFASIADDDERADDSPLHEQVRQALEQFGVHPRHQATLVAELCNISVSQARRKLQGSVWLFDEIQALARHCNCSVDELTRRSCGPGLTPPQSATALFDGQQLSCEIVVGRLLGPRELGRIALQAVRDGTGWLAGHSATLSRLRPDAPRYAVDRLVLSPEASPPSMRVAVIDDDPLTAESLCDWFEASEIQATAFTSAPAILSGNPMQFDAFVVDYILTAGVNSGALIEHIRAVKPNAPIALLTGHLKDGIASEHDLTTMMRSHKVMFFEKPVRPAMLAAALQNSLDKGNQAAHE